MLPAPQAPGLMQALNEAGSGPSSAAIGSVFRVKSLRVPSLPRAAITWR